jgi:hypothetical protein
MKRRLDVQNKHAVIEIKSKKKEKDNPQRE